MQSDIVIHAKDGQILIAVRHLNMKVNIHDACLIAEALIKNARLAMVQQKPLIEVPENIALVKKDN